MLLEFFLDDNTLDPILVLHIIIHTHVAQELVQIAVEVRYVSGIRRSVVIFLKNLMYEVGILVVNLVELYDGFVARLLLYNLEYIVLHADKVALLDALRV